MRTFIKISYKNLSHITLLQQEYKTYFKEYQEENSDLKNLSFNFWTRPIKIQLTDDNLKKLKNHVIYNWLEDFSQSDSCPDWLRNNIDLDIILEVYKEPSNIKYLIKLLTEANEYISKYNKKLSSKISNELKKYN